MKEDVLLYGSGGHAKVVLESIASEGKRVVGFFDDAPVFEVFKAVPVLGKYNAETQLGIPVIITIGNNKIRKLIAQKVFHSFGKTIYSSNSISADAAIGEGSMVLQNAVINADATIGKHVIINTRAVVEHDCVIGDFVHVAPGAVICGNTKVGEGTLIGANAVLAPNLTIGKWCQISAGSSVLEDIPDFSTVTGVPGKIIRTED